MSSRLDRLFILLESGSTPYTRQAAATQLGELQRLHPHELHSLLRRIYRLLSSTCWDTRVAAAQAIGAVVKHTPPWNPVPVNSNNQEFQNGGKKAAAPTLRLEMLDIGQILNTSSCLTASQGSEFDMEESDTKDSLQRARQQLNAKLGFPLMDSGEMVTKEDLMTLGSQETTEDVKPNVADILASSAMSSREANRARRKAKAFAKTRSVSIGGT